VGIRQSQRYALEYLSEASQKKSSPYRRGFWLARHTNVDPNFSRANRDVLNFPVFFHPAISTDFDWDRSRSMAVRANLLANLRPL
jgi:hypothetical protein